MFSTTSPLAPKHWVLEFLVLLEAPLSVEVPALDFQVAVHLEVSQVAVHLEVFQVAVHLEVLLPKPMRNEARKKSSLFFRFRCSWASETFKDTSFSPPASFYSRAGHQHLLMHISCTDPSYAELSYKMNLKKSSPHALAWNFWSCCRRHFLGRFWLWTFKWWSAWRCCCWGLSNIKTGTLVAQHFRNGIASKNHSSQTLVCMFPCLSFGVVGSAFFPRKYLQQPFMESASWRLQVSTLPLCLSIS